MEKVNNNERRVEELYSRWRYKKMNNGQNRERKKKERTLLKMTIVKNEQY